jgi:hypothetical protein
MAFSDGKGIKGVSLVKTYAPTHDEFEALETADPVDLDKWFEAQGGYDESLRPQSPQPLWW